MSRKSRYQPRTSAVTPVPLRTISGGWWVRPRAGGRFHHIHKRTAVAGACGRDGRLGGKCRRQVPHADKCRACLKRMPA